jgi:trimeric autotransporter adhesin
MTKAQRPLGPSKATVQRREQQLKAQSEHDAIVEAMKYLLCRNKATVKRSERRKRARLRLQNATSLDVHTTSVVRCSLDDTERKLKAASSSRIAAAAIAGGNIAEHKLDGSARTRTSAARERMKANAAAAKASREQAAEEMRAASPTGSAAPHTFATMNSLRGQAAPNAIAIASSSAALTITAAATARRGTAHSTAVRPQATFLANNSLRAPPALIATAAARSVPARASSVVVPQPFAATNSLRTEQIRAVGAATANPYTASSTALPHSFTATNSLRPELLLLSVQAATMRAPAATASADVSAPAAAPAAAVGAVAAGARAANITQFEVPLLAYWVLGEAGRARPVTAPQSIPNRFTSQEAYLQVSVTVSNRY